MVVRQKAILIGDIELAKYHPLTGFDREFKAILTGFDVDQTTDYDQLREENLQRYDLCISFVDRWIRMTDEQTTGLLSFVIHGGGLLVVHNGIAIQARPELAQLAGGKFIGHPEQKVLTYRPKATGHAIMDGIGAFAVKEEPYQFVLDNLIETTILLEYESDGKCWPAGWAHPYGCGKVVCLSPGHNLETLLDPTYRKIIERCGTWLTGL